MYSITSTNTGYVRTVVDKFSYYNVGGSNRDISQHIVYYQGRDVGIGWMACHTLETMGAACRVELEVDEALDIVSNEGNCFGFAYAMEVKPRVALLEDDVSHMMVDHEVATVVEHGVVSYTVEGVHVLDGEDVYTAMWVVPDPSISSKVHDCVDKGFTPIGANGDGLVDVVDVGEEVSIAEDIDSGLIVKEHPEPVE